MSQKTELIRVISKRLLIPLLFLLVFTVIAVPLARAGKGIIAATPLLAMTAGAIGGFVSLQRRLKEFSEDDLELLFTSWIYTILAPLVGGILALLLYVLFLSGLLAGDLFPKFVADAITTVNQTGSDAKPQAIIGFESIFDTHGESYKDYAKLLFWAFVGGFSERFVVDVIGQFQRQASNNTQE